MRERTVENDSSRFLERVIFCNSCRDCDRTTCEECKQQLQKADRKAVLKETLREYFSERFVTECDAMFDELGFYDKPAAIKHHGNYSGGLFDHSFAVGMKLKELTDQLGLKWKSEGSPILVGLLHDICKCDNYILVDGSWEWNKEQALPGHGEKSLIMVLERMQIHEDAGMCIRWHMGAFDDAKNWEYYSRAVRKDEKVLWTHTADMYVSNVLGI